VKAVGGSPSDAGDPAVSSARLLEAAPLEDPSGIPSHSTKTYTSSELTDAEFRKVWSQGAPLIVTGLGEKFGIRWRPEHFREKHGSQTCSIVECQTDASKRVTVGEAALPDLYDEFQKGVPMPNHCRRDGVLNIASHFPSNTVMPDLGTWTSVLVFVWSIDDGGFGKRAENVRCAGND